MDESTSRWDSCSLLEVLATLDDATRNSGGDVEWSKPISHAGNASPHFLFLLSTTSTLVLPTGACRVGKDPL